MANTSAIWQQTAHTTYQLSSLSSQQEPYKKAYPLTKNILKFSGKSQENGPLTEK